MALETVVYPQGPFGYSCNKDLYTMGGGGTTAWSFEQTGHYDNWDQYSPSSSVMQNVKEWDHNSSPDHHHHPLLGLGVLPTMEIPSASTPPMTTAPQGRRKRRRTKTCKNKEEVENQRMTHIAVERNRRKQMNEYLAVLRSLMPASYAQRGDQASIIGGAINFVKELEQHLQTLEVQKKLNQQPPDQNGFSSASPFAEFFSFPQYSTRSSQCNNSPVATASGPIAENSNTWPAAVADIEVTMVETHANIKILSKRRPKQLLKMVAGFQSLRLTVLHLNVTSVDQMVLYSVSVKVEDGCQLTTVDEIAAAVNQMLGRIEEESFLLS